MLYVPVFRTLTATNLKYTVAWNFVDNRVTAPQANFTEGKLTDPSEFGFGLSYTTFKYSDIAVDASASHPDEHAIRETYEPFLGYDGTNSLYDVLFSVTATITNAGNATGSEVAQFYLAIPEDDQPPCVLRGFNKVKDIAAGASATATFELRRKDLSMSLNCMLLFGPCISNI
ncbi:hypothetical protein VKT23_015144 [Stygiomarasmius scandens]|uniref:beta-glucosidase n=1 Tax=Marasmiellus scandens TaxID=2682957 RepID=A0ABR1J3B3_9AGAR